MDRERDREGVRRGADAMESFDARLARARARAESARADVDRIERWLSESARVAPASSREYAVDERSLEAPSPSFAAQISPPRSVIHRPIPRRALSASVDGTEWSMRRASSTFGAFGGVVPRSVPSVVSEEDGRSAFQSLTTVPVNPPALSRPTEEPNDWNTPPGTPVRQQPSTPPRARWRTRSEDFTGLPPRAFTSIDVGTSRASTSSLLESVANEAELERLRLSGTDFDTIKK